MQKIRSKNNPIVKEIKSLDVKKYRWKNKLFIIEGIKLIQEALDSKVKFKYIVFSESLLKTKFGQELLNCLNVYNKVIEVDDNTFSYLSDTNNPQGVLGVVEFKLSDYRELINQEDIRLVYLDSLMDPGNLGTVIRSADAFNFHGIIMGEGSVDPYNPKVVRATMGSLFRVPLYFDDGEFNVLKDLRSNNFKIHTTHLKGSIANHTIKYNGNYIIVIGNESLGVSEEIIEISDTLIKIPIPGGAESLNASVASSILMYEAAKQSVEKSWVLNI